MKKMKALQIIAAAMAVTVAATSAPVNVFAYGETSASSTLFTDTQNISDYATWKDNVWNKKDDQGNLTGEGESYDSSRIILTPGKTAKDLGFAWYSQKKGEPAVKIGKKEDLSDAQEFKGTATGSIVRIRKIHIKHLIKLRLKDFLKKIQPIITVIPMM